MVLKRKFQNFIPHCTSRISKTKNNLKKQPPDNTKCWQGCQATGALINYSWGYKMGQPLYKIFC